MGVFMKYTFLILTSLFLFSGCASSVDALHVENEKVLNFGMANSKKVEIINSNTSKTYVIITYLNPIEHELITKDTEKFIVGTYLATGDDSENQVELSNFEINGVREGIKVSVLDKDAPLLKLVSSSNPWARYILVESPLSEEIDMKFSFESDHSKRVSAVFRKDY